MKKLNKGFTMIELLVIIAIISILATTLVPKLIKEIRKATVAKVQHNLGVIRSRLSLDDTFLDEFPDLAGDENTTTVGDDDPDLLKAYSIEPTPPFTDENGSHEESSEVVSSRNDKGGWYYIRDLGEIYANLPNGAYTKDAEYEIWDENDYDWSTDISGSSLVSNPYKQYTIEATVDFDVVLASGYGYGIYIQASEDTSGYIFQYDKYSSELNIVTREYGNETTTTTLADLTDLTGINTDLTEINDDWWEAEHTVTISVTNNNSTSQNVNIVIDSGTTNKIILGTYNMSTTIKSNNDTTDNYTGIRTWNTDYNDVNVNAFNITEL